MREIRVARTRSFDDKSSIMVKFQKEKKKKNPINFFLRAFGNSFIFDRSKVIFESRICGGKEPIRVSVNRVSIGEVGRT